MPISVRCPTCGQAYRVRDELAGKEAKCRCGQRLVIPAVAVMATLLDEEILAPLPEPEAQPLAAPRRAGWWRRRARAPFGTGLGKKRARRKGFHPATLAIVLLGAVGMMVIGAVILVLENIDPMAKPFVPSLPSTPPRRVRWPTPQAVFEAHCRAQRNGDWKTAYEVLTPEYQRSVISELVLFALTVITTQDDPAWQGVCKRHGIDPAKFTSLALLRSLSAAEVEAQLNTKAGEIADQLTNKSAFFADAMSLVYEDDLGFFWLVRRSMQAQLSDLVITGDSASGTATVTVSGQTRSSPIHFRRVDGEWRLVGRSLEASTFSR